MIKSIEANNMTELEFLDAMIKDLENHLAIIKSRIKKIESCSIKFNAKAGGKTW